MKAGRKFLAGLLVLVMVAGVLPVTASAANNADTAADTLYELGLFKGTGTDAYGNPVYELDRAPTRHEAVTMFVRLIGKESEALSGTWNIPFTDVEAWARPYVGYAYANGLTNGTSSTTYSGEREVTASEYLTFVLRALGYTSGRDFQWDSAWTLSDNIGITDGEYTNTDIFLRADVAVISLSALAASVSNSDLTLYESSILMRSAEEYRAEIKQKVDGYVRRDMYDVALELIKNAQKLLPNDAELQTLYNSTASNYKDTLCAEAIAEADEHIANDDYPSAIIVLKDALADIGEDEELSALLSIYEDDYRESVLDEAYAIARTANYMDALVLITEAKSVLGDDDELSVAFEDIKTYAPMSLFDMEVYSGGVSFSRESIECVDGTVYNNAYRLAEDHHNYWWNENYSMDFTVRLGGKYNTVSGTLIWPYELRSFGESNYFSISFYEGDRLIYSSEICNVENETVDFECNISGVDLLTVSIDIVDHLNDEYVACLSSLIVRK